MATSTDNAFLTETSKHDNNKRDISSSLGTNNSLVGTKSMWFKIYDKYLPTFIGVRFSNHLKKLFYFAINSSFKISSPGPFNAQV